jgi:hypothetical protein
MQTPGTMIARRKTTNKIIRQISNLSHADIAALVEGMAAVDHAQARLRRQELLEV